MIPASWLCNRFTLLLFAQVLRLSPLVLRLNFGRSFSSVSAIVFAFPLDAVYCRGNRDVVVDQKEDATGGFDSELGGCLQACQLAEVVLLGFDGKEQPIVAENKIVGHAAEPGLDRHEAPARAEPPCQCQFEAIFYSALWCRHVTLSVKNLRTRRLLRR